MRWRGRPRWTPRRTSYRAMPSSASSRPTCSSRSSSRSRIASRRTSSRPTRRSGAQHAKAETAVVLVRGGDDAERVAGCAFAEARVLRRGERLSQQRLDAADPRGRERQGPDAARTADRAAGLRRVADERRVVRAALRAAGQVGQVAGHPEQLELERERERVEGGARRARAGLVQRVEETRQRNEGALVPLLLGEE